MHMKWTLSTYSLQSIALCEFVYEEYNTNAKATEMLP